MAANNSLTQSEARSIKRSLSDLKDRIALLESDLKNSQRRIREDMKRLIEMVDDKDRGF